MFGKFMSDRTYLILQMCFGTIIVGLSPVFWQYPELRTGVIASFTLGVFIILHTLYFDSKRTDQRIKTLEGKVEALENELRESKQDTVTT